MRDPIRPLSHHDASHADDEALRREARGYLARWGELQLVAELYEKLRTSSFEWWSFNFLRHAWPPHARLDWLRERADLRQTITCALTGLPKKTARHKSPEFQAELIESVLANGDVSDEAFDLAFAASDVAVYGPARDVWNEFRNRFPWDDDSIANQRFVAWLLRALLTDRSSLDGEASRKPILTPTELRVAIDPKVWHTRLPVEVRAAIDQARLKLERTRPREPFHARNELAIATPEVIAQNIPLGELLPVIAAADAALAFTSFVVNPAPTSGVEATSGTWSIEPPFSDVPAPRNSMPTISLRRTG